MNLLLYYCDHVVLGTLIPSGKPLIMSVSRVPECENIQMFLDSQFTVFPSDSACNEDCSGLVMVLMVLTIALLERLLDYVQVNFFMSTGTVSWKRINRRSCNLVGQHDT